MATFDNSALVSTTGSNTNMGVAKVGKDDSYTTTNSYVARLHYTVFGAAKVVIVQTVTGANAADMKVSLTGNDIEDVTDPDTLVFVDEDEITSTGASTKLSLRTLTYFPQISGITALKIWAKSSVTDTAATNFIKVMIY